MSLTLENDTIEGDGRDQIGTFTVSGQRGPDKQVKFVKQYHEMHSVEYVGELSANETSMHGTYFVGDANGSYVMTAQQ